MNRVIWVGWIPFCTSIVPFFALVLEFEGLYPSGPWQYVSLVPLGGALAAVVYAGANRVPPHKSWPWLLPFLVLAVLNCVASFAVVLDPDPYFTQGPSPGRHTVEWFSWLLSPLLLPVAACISGLSNSRIQRNDAAH